MDCLCQEFPFSGTAESLMDFLVRLKHVYQDRISLALVMSV